MQSSEHGDLAKGRRKVLFRYSGNTIDNFRYEGFLDTKANTILAESTEIECDKAPKSIYRTTEGTFIHAPGQTPKRINHAQVKTLPILKTNLTNHLFTLPKNWVFNHTDLHHNNLEDAILARMEKRLTRMEQGEKADNAIDKTKREQTDEILGMSVMITLTIVVYILVGAETNQDHIQFEVGTRPQVIKSLGTILKPVGFLASGGESIFSSVFLDVPVPKIPKYDCRKNKFDNCTIDDTNLNRILTNNPTLVKEGQVLARKNQPNSSESQATTLTHCISLCLERNCERVAYSQSLQTCRINFAPPETYPIILRKAIEKQDLILIATNWTTVEVDRLQGLPEYCNQNFSEPILAKFYKEAANQEIERLWNTANNSFVNLKKAFQLVEQGTNTEAPERKKRGASAGIAAALALPLVGLGITFWESYQVRKYVKKLEAKFEEFAEETRSFLGKQVVFNRELIKVYEALEERMDQISCNLDIVSYEVMNRRRFQEWSELTRTLLSGVLQNQLTMPVLPSVLSLDHLQQLTNDTIFQDTIYQKNPNSALTLGRMTVVGLRRLQTSWRYHFVLILPTLKRESIYNRYAVEQVGIESNGTCMVFQMADEVYEINGRFYKVLDEQCYTRDNTLKICLKPSSERSKKEHTSSACLNKEENCQVKMVKCEDRVSFSVAGLLAYSKNPVKGISKNAGASSLVFEVLSSIAQKTNFYSWQNFSHILVGERMIQSLKNPLLHVEIEPKTKLPSWEQFIKDTAIQTSKANLSNLVQIIDLQQQTLNRLEQSKGALLFASDWWDMAGNIAAYSAIALWLVTLITMCCCTRNMRKQAKRNLNSGSGTAAQQPININITEALEKSRATLRKRKRQKEDEYRQLEMEENSLYYSTLDRDFEPPQSAAAMGRRSTIGESFPMSQRESSQDQGLIDTGITFLPKRTSSPVTKGILIGERPETNKETM
ncbi:hypothetical protein ACHWQZ_G010516 [Mnemiopsis leidyi]